MNLGTFKQVLRLKRFIIFKRQYISNLIWQGIPEDEAITFNAQFPYDFRQDMSTCNITNHQCLTTQTKMTAKPTYDEHRSTYFTFP